MMQKFLVFMRVQLYNYFASKRSVGFANFLGG